MKPDFGVGFLAVLATSPIWILLTHIAVARLCRRAPPQLVAATACLAGIVPTTLLAWVLGVADRRSFLQTPIEVTYGCVVYSCLAYSYFHVFNMSETARRIRILAEMYLAGSLTAGEISRQYSGSALVETRIDRLVVAHQLEMRGDRYMPAGRLLYIAARVTRGWRSVLGFDRDKFAAGRGRLTD